MADINTSSDISFEDVHIGNAKTFFAQLVDAFEKRDVKTFVSSRYMLQVCLGIPSLSKIPERK